MVLFKKEEAKKILMNLEEVKAGLAAPEAH